jgi:hypothetical protein
MAKLAVLIVVLTVYLFEYSSAADISAFLIPYDTGGGVQKCGSKYRDTSSYTCKTCPTDQEIDPDTIGGDGQYQGCRCVRGYATVENDCSGVSFRFSHHLFCHFCSVHQSLILSNRIAPARVSASLVRGAFH